MSELKISMASARVNAGLSQKQAAKILGVSVETIRNYEKGKNIPTWDKVMLIERHYGIPAGNIFFGKKFAISENDSAPAI